MLLVVGRAFRSENVQVSMQDERLAIPRYNALDHAARDALLCHQPFAFLETCNLGTMYWREACNTCGSCTLIKSRSRLSRHGGNPHSAFTYHDGASGYILNIFDISIQPKGVPRCLLRRHATTANVSLDILWKGCQQFCSLEL